MDLSDSDSADPLRPLSPSDQSLSDKVPSPALPVICRVKQGWWWMIPLGTLEAAFMFFAPFFRDDSHPNQNLWAVAIITWPFAAGMGWGMIYMALDLMRGEIRADADGLTWRRQFGDWKSARWDEITDYYQKQTGTKISRLIETPAGKCELSSHFEGINTLTQMVAQKTTHLGKRGWEIKGVRPNEAWSHTFSPWSGEQKWAAPLVSSLMLFTAVVLVLAPILSPSQPKQPLGFWLDEFPIILLSVIFGPIIIGGTICMLNTLWRERNFAWNHRDEKLVLDTQGLTFISQALNLRANWDELKAITYLPKEKGREPVQIETSNGNFIVWKINNERTWSQTRIIIEQYRPELFEVVNKKAIELTNLENDLDGERGAWSGGEVGVGARRWGFRSRGTRFTLQCASFIVLFLPVFYPIFKYSSAIAEDDVPAVISWPLFGGLYVLSILIVIASWLWFRYTAILADEEGLEVRSPFHPPHRASWRNINGRGQDAWGEFVRANGRKLYFMRFFPPVRVEELRAHIEQNMTYNR